MLRNAKKRQQRGYRCVIEETPGTVGRTGTTSPDYHVLGLTAGEQRGEARRVAGRAAAAARLGRQAALDDDLRARMQLSGVSCTYGSWSLAQ